LGEIAENNDHNIDSSARFLEQKSFPESSNPDLGKPGRFTAENLFNLSHKRPIKHRTKTLFCFEQTQLALLKVGKKNFLLQFSTQNVNLVENYNNCLFLHLFH
jgi:hypothetical protein